MAHETEQVTSPRWRARPKRSVTASATPPAPLEHGNAATVGGGLGLRVLIVDDERLSRQTALRQLHEAGFEADAVDGADRALGALAARQWDFVLCDLRLPGREGMDLLRAIRRQHPSVDVVVMTAYGTVETAVAAMRHGAADYLTKPFRFQELEHRLRKLGELRSLRREIESLRALRPATSAPVDRESAAVLAGSAAERAPIGVFTIHFDGRDRVALPETVRAFEAELIRWAMDRVGGQQNLAAELLGLPRTTLQSKLNRDGNGARPSRGNGAASGPGSRAGASPIDDAALARAAAG